MRLAFRLGSYCTRRFKDSMSASPETTPLRLEQNDVFYEPNRRYPLFRMGERFKHEQELPQDDQREEEYGREGEQYFPAQNNGSHSTPYPDPYYAGDGQQYYHDIAPYPPASYSQELQQQQYYDSP